ncbi:putative transcription factor [Sesbania bispinosa]|nr:putative transcription factor [Sesbania bispinosa]
MSSSRPCTNCTKTSFIRDDITGELICSSCGTLQQFDQFEAQIGGISGPQGTFINVGTAGSGSVYTYRDRKLFAAHNSIDELACRLGLGSKSVDIKSMVSAIMEVGMDDLAKEVHAVVSTCRARYRELLETLVKLAQVLPWGKDITTKNIVKNVPFVVQYMEKKSMSKPVEKKKNLDQPGLDLGDVVTECLKTGCNADRESIKDVHGLQISPECLSMMYEKFLNENHCAKLSRSSANAKKRKRLGLDLQECREWWNRKSELSKKILLKHLLEKDVGVDTMPPSFVTGQLKCKMRRERIDAAKWRIKRIMHPLDVGQGDAGNPDLLDSTYPEKRKKKRGMVVDDIDWEDLIIETLILHQIKEEEIEKGHYNT